MPAYGLRQIIEVQDEAGACVEQVVISGGAGQSDFVRTLLAEAGGKPVVAPRTEEPVLLGSAILGAVASGAFGTMGEAMAQLSASGSVHQPATGTIADLHEERYAAFKALQLVYRDMRAC